MVSSRLGTGEKCRFLGLWRKQSGLRPSNPCSKEPSKVLMSLEAEQHRVGGGVFQGGLCFCIHFKSGACAQFREGTESSDLPSTSRDSGRTWGVPMAPALCPQRLLEDLGSPWCLAWFLHSAGVRGRSWASGGLVTRPSLPPLLKLNPLAAPTRSKHLVCHAKNIPQQRALPPAVKLISGLKNSPKSLYWQL